MRTPATSTARSAGGRRPAAVSLDDSRTLTLPGTSAVGPPWASSGVLGCRARGRPFTPMRYPALRPLRVAVAFFAGLLRDAFLAAGSAFLAAAFFAAGFFSGLS